MTKSNELRSDFFSGTFHVGSTVTASCSGNLEQLNNYIVPNTADGKTLRFQQFRVASVASVASNKL